MAKKTGKPIIVYGIPNCGSVKKAFDWLKDHQVLYEFHDYKKKGISEDKLNEWCNHFGWENVINKAGTTWKALTDEEKSAVTNQASAIELMMRKTSLIRRPVIEAKGKYLIRFDEQQYADALVKK